MVHACGRTKPDIFRNVVVIRCSTPFSQVQSYVRSACAVNRAIIGIRVNGQKRVEN